MGLRVSVKPKHYVVMFNDAGEVLGLVQNTSPDERRKVNLNFEFSDNVVLVREAALDAEQRKKVDKFRARP